MKLAALPAASSRRLQMVLVVHALLILWAIAVSAACLSGEAICALRFACCVFTLLSAWLAASWLWTGERILSLYFLFLLSVLVFNGGQIVLYAFDPTTRLMLNHFRPETSLRTILFVTQSVMFLHLGALLAKRKQRTGGERCDTLDKASASRTGWWLLSIAALPTIVTLRSAIQNVMLHGYMFLFQTDKATGLDAVPERIASFLMPATFLILAGNAGKRSVRIFCIGCVLLYSSVQLFLGSRASAVTALVAFAWLWERCAGKIKRSMIVGAALACMLVLPVIGVVRDVSGNERSSLDFLANAADKVGNPATALLYEMGGSMRTVGQTLEYVPGLRDYDLGTGYLYAGLAILPNVFGGPLHPSMVHGDFSEWLIGNADPVTAALGGGLGYSLIAEGYANFGWAGALIVMLLFGFGVQSLANWAYNLPSAGRLATAATMISFLLFFARGESMDTLRPLIWYGALPYGIVQLTKRRIRGRSDLLQPAAS